MDGWMDGGGGGHAKESKVVYYSRVHLLI